MAITAQDKQQIRTDLKGYCDQAGSIDKAANSLVNVSGTSIRNVLNPDFPNISDELWRTIRAQISGPDREEWEIVETPVFNDIYGCIEYAQEYREVTWIIGGAGSGKTTAAREYKKRHKDVIYVLCDEDMYKRDFVLELGRAMGIKVNTQRRVRDSLLQMVNEILEMENPLIILDEADKLPDPVLHYFITLYNRLDGKAGIILLSTSYMKKRLENGLLYDKRGFQEINSRLGHRFYTALSNTANEVHSICQANGVRDSRVISEIIKDVERCGFDIRRAKKKIKAMRVKQMSA